MRHRPEGDTEEPEEKEDGRRRIDLSMAQVSGSAVAAVIAAKLASTLGVYGTIVGAGVISVIATCGGPLFQHLFRRTGEQVRGATAVAKPKARQVPVGGGPRDDRTLMLGTVRGPLPSDGEFGSATTHGTRVRGWKRPAIAAALVFGVTMGGITTYELVSGQDFSGTRGTTTFGSVVGGGSTGQRAPHEDKNPSPARSGAAEGDGRPGDGGRSPSTDGTPSPGGQDTERTGTTTPSPEPTPTPSGSTGGGSTPTPAPTGPTAEPTDPTREPATGTSGLPEVPTTPTPAAPGTGTGTGGGGAE
ncbi:hypothetical protein ACFWV1_15110 [Streptomyces sp. NPDC058700]|uniref:hypothetical protein n=1 Tax=Streptomyces sp. NPDC058700 TaxID=3346607 RepID=UPI003656EB17